MDRSRDGRRADCGTGRQGRARTSAKSPDVSASVRTSLNQAGFKDVSVSQDRDKGVVTLGGQHVATDSAKSQAESVAMSLAGTQVVSNQIAVIPPGGESDAIKMNSALIRVSTTTWMRLSSTRSFTRA